MFQPTSFACLICSACSYNYSRVRKVFENSQCRGSEAHCLINVAICVFYTVYILDSPRQRKNAQYEILHFKKYSAYQNNIVINYNVSAYIYYILYGIHVQEVPEYDTSHPHKTHLPHKYKTQGKDKHSAAKFLCWISTSRCSIWVKTMLACMCDHKQLHALRAPTL